jgi:meso-butanediol dehydrogenase/(S,S)-butanediol dehydrogenase/diacetyl reductase
VTQPPRAGGPPPDGPRGRLAGRAGLITGAASGIGAAGAELFAAEGAALVLVDVDAERGQQVAGAITARGGRAEFVRGDAASADDIAGAVRVAVASFGRLDLLWANAGIGVAKTVPQTSVEEWNRVLAVNLTGAFLLAKFGIPELAAAGGGTMVITGSANSLVADRSWAAYCASKGGLLMLCRALALDHASDGVRVNIVCPGSVSTPLHEAWLRGRPGGQPLAEVRAADRAAHPLDRFADPAEVARAALFLSCAESSFTTGSPLLVDGGVTA